MSTVGTAPLDRVRTRVPLYTVSEAASIIGISPSTFDTWATGYERRPAGRSAVKGVPIVTRIGIGQGASIPFVGLAEAYFIASLRRSGISLQKIRHALSYLEREVGLEHAFAHQAVYTLGPQIVYELSVSEGDEELRELIDIGNGVGGNQLLFAPIVQNYLSGVIFDEGRWALELRLRLRYPTADIRVRSGVASGRPFFSARGVTVTDVVGRALAGDSAELLAEDYRLSLNDVREVIEVARPRAA